ncbi:MAG: hypothetical protein ACI4TT_02355, partial [Christensenellales bacterium]
PLQTILAKYRPYDKFINKSLIDHDEAKQLNEYLLYSAQHPDEPTQIHFVGEEEAMKKMQKEIEEKLKKPKQTKKIKKQTKQNKKPNKEPNEQEDNKSQKSSAELEQKL